MRRTIDKLMPKLALPIIGAAAVILIIFMIQGASQTNTETNAYIRVINCIISVPATSRTQNDIERCYSTIENDLNITLQRYKNPYQP